MQSKRPSKMVYCPYCERKVRPILSQEKRGILYRFVTGLFKLVFYLSTCGLGYLLVRFAKAFCKLPLECPICGAILEEGNYHGE